jgi:hypothetical protein
MCKRIHICLELFIFGIHLKLFAMKKIYLLLFIVVFSCKNQEDIIKEIIGNTYLRGLTKINQVEILKEDIYDLPIHYSEIKEFVNPDSKKEYYTIRYIFKTKRGVYRMFYLINYTDKKIELKSSDPKEFYEPLIAKTFGENQRNTMNGDNLMDIYRY